ncbi:MAG: hypothetical protein H7Y13_16645 [Sphingobacteriaceae bacterium]|nr:hypothetical protein [Sphingobacteriaceae bacterium]
MIKTIVIVFLCIVVSTICLPVNAQDTTSVETESSAANFTGSVKVAIKTISQKINDSVSTAAKLNVIKWQTLRLDTVKNKIAPKANQYKSTLERKLKQPSDSLIKEKAEAYATSKLKAGNLPGLKINNRGNKKPEDLFNLSVENNTLYLSDSPLQKKAGFLNNISIAGKFTIARIPVNLDLSNNFSSEQGFSAIQSNLFKFNFDKESMLNSFKTDVDRFKDVRATLLKGLELPDFTSRALMSKLHQMPEAKFLTSNPGFISYLKKPENVNFLLSLEPKELKVKLAEIIEQQKQPLNEYASEKIGNIKNKQASAAESEIDSIKKSTTDSYLRLNNTLSKSGQQKISSGITDSIVSVIASIKNKLAENGLDSRKVELVQKFIAGKGGVDDLEDELFNELSKNPNPGKLQSAFRKVRSLQTGAIGGQLPGSFLNRDVFAKGFNLSLKTRSGNVSFGLGKQKDLGASKDAGFESSVYASPRFYTYLSVPTNKSSVGSGKLSWIGSFSSQDDHAFHSAAAVGRNSMTFTVTQALVLPKMGRMTMDISKSASKYNNSLDPGSDHLMLDKSVLSNYISDDLFETMSLGLNHDLENRRLNVSSNLYFNYAGTGFQNPGLAGGSQMKMRVGGNVKKVFYKNKLAMSLRTDLRNTPVGFSNNSHWQNLQIQYDSRFKINKKVNLSLKYLENGMNKVGGVSTPVYSSTKLQFGGNANYKLAGKYSFSNITIAQQQVQNSQLLASASNFITVNYLQSLVLNNTSITANIFYNKETSPVKLIGNMINGDIGCQYSFLKMNITSSITYLDNQDVARQVGIKQNLQLMAGKHFDISAYADFRKNLIQPLFPDLYTAGRGELSIKYYLKNKF